MTQSSKNPAAATISVTKQKRRVHEGGDDFLARRLG